MHTLKLIPYWSTFCFYHSTQSFWAGVYRHGTSWLGNICPLLFAKMLQILRLRGHHLCTALFRSPHIFWIGFRPGLWLGHSKTLIFFWWSHSLVDLDVCFGALSCRKMKFLFIFSFLAEARGFCSNTDWYLELFIISSTLTKAPVPAEEKHPKAWCCHHHGSLWLWCSFGDAQCCFCAKHTF